MWNVRTYRPRGGRIVCNYPYSSASYFSSFALRTRYSAIIVIGGNMEFLAETIVWLLILGTAAFVVAFVVHNL